MSSNDPKELDTKSRKWSGFGMMEIQATTGGGAMLRRVIVAGLLGGVVWFAWAMVVNGVFGFKARIDMNAIAGEQQVYEVLEQHVTRPGRYACNPPLTADGRFPEDKPAFSVLYGGMGHGSAGWMLLTQLPIFFLGPLIAAGLLAATSPGILASYPRKVIVVGALGLFLGVVARLTAFGIGDYPPVSALLLALHDLALWTLIGAVLAWRIRPARAAGAPAE
jgi:hypothetical protein